MVIKSISYDQAEILRWISELYLSGAGFDLDPTYGAGGFYRGIPRSKMCFDLVPRLKANHNLFPELAAVWPVDVRALPIKDECLESIIFDPPFLARGGSNSIMIKKYGEAGKPAGVWKLYREGIEECYRVLKPQGHLVVKCQDFVYGRTQYMIHVEIMNMAVEIGLYPKDLFIYLARSRPRGFNQENQNHARKFHSYFWVFGKQNINVGYSRDRRISVHKNPSGPA